MDYQSIDHAKEEIRQYFSTISDADLETAVAKAHRLYRTDWSRRPIAERVRVNGKAAEILGEKVAECAGYLTLEVGKLPTFATNEVNLAVGILDYYARNAEAFLAPKSIPGFPAAELVARPMGVLPAIEP